LGILLCLAIGQDRPFRGRASASKRCATAYLGAGRRAAGERVAALVMLVMLDTNGVAPLCPADRRDHKSRPAQSKQDRIST